MTSVVNLGITSAILGGLLSHHERLEKFVRVNFKRWQQKMLIYLTTLNLAKVLSEDPLVMAENEPDRQKIMALDTWKQIDYLYRNYMFNSLANSLYIVFCAKSSAKELWESLDKKYKTEDAGAKKFDSRKKGESTSSVKANVIEHGKSSGVRKKPTVNKGSKLGPRGGVAKKPAYKPQKPSYRFLGKCYNYGSEGRRASDCCKQRKPYKTNPRAHMANMQEHSHDEDDMHLSSAVSKVNMVGSNPREWWTDTGATSHISSEKKLFTTFDPVTNGEKLFMGNSANSIVGGK
ncbi:uncharacterized protein LOC114293282 [Camellia sinensis]|uniref:uncharacterized protein LOC114293282 n=1 Tax=Camellia sinensis TaxID=4442 RepID=UPI001035FD60|nr:uncharacterized protein LOC114293282 [Camellia sinensis]